MILKQLETILRNIAFATGSVLATLLFLNTFGLQTWFIQGRAIEPLVYYFTGSGMALVTITFGAFFAWVVVCIYTTTTWVDVSEEPTSGEKPENPG